MAGCKPVDNLVKLARKRIKEDMDGDDHPNTIVANHAKNKAVAAADMVKLLTKVQDMMNDHYEQHQGKMDPTHAKYFARLDGIAGRALKKLGHIAKTRNAATRGANRANPDFPEIAKKEPKETPKYKRPDSVGEPQQLNTRTPVSNAGGKKQK